MYIIFFLFSGVVHYVFEALIFFFFQRLKDQRRLIQCHTHTSEEHERGPDRILDQLDHQVRARGELTQETRVNKQINIFDALLSLAVKHK